MNVGNGEFIPMHAFLAQPPPVVEPVALQRPRAGVRFDSSAPGQDEYDTDGSWTLQDATGNFHEDMHNQLLALASSTTQRSFTTTHLSKNQRRYVHATAHVLGLEHASIGSKRRYRQMVISKPQPCVFDLTFPEEYLSSSAPVGQIQHEGPANVHSNLPIRATSLNNICGVAGAPEDGYETERTIRKKRKRVPKQEGAFACSFDGCDRVYDRASDRKKHEQVHQPSLTQKYRCAQCGKGFRYPKDLRRHGKTHGIDSATESNTESSSSVLDMSQVFTSSEIESVPSLSLASRASSLDLVNTWLDTTNISAPESDFSRTTSGLRWSDSKAFLGIYADVEESDEMPDDEEEFLEMARVNRLCLDERDDCL